MSGTDDGGLLEVRHLTAAYGAIEALSDVSLHVRAGEIVALVGPNGAGKSTLLRTISGVLKPRRGEIVFDAMSVGGRSPPFMVRHGLVHIPEGRQILKRMTVLDNLLMGAFVRSDAAVRSDLQAVLHRFPRLRERGEMAAGALSGGEQQMLAIGRALMARPRLLMMDEPSLGLAPVLVTEVFHLVQELKDQGITILLVEQNARQALRIADRAYVLETGRIALEGPSDELLGSRLLQESYLGVS
jgi:branched-chain amino acid transport system ATP-binding protein